MEQLITDGLSKILDFEVPEDLIKYIQSIENERDLNEYMKTLLDFDNPQHKNFFLELCKRKFTNKGNSLPKQQKKKISKNKQQQDFVSSEVKPSLSAEDVKPKKKTKYVNLYSQEGKNAQVVLLKGRHHCDCQASKHELINNCLQCGRIVCKQEGSGPCLFCGNLVCTPEEQREINAKTKASAKLMESLMEKSRPAGWEAALSHRNRLLEYDRTSERRTKVTDDDSDYFSANSVWLSAAEKDKLQKYQQSLHEKKHASRLQKKMTFDFAARGYGNSVGLSTAEKDMLQKYQLSLHEKKHASRLQKMTFDFAGRQIIEDKTIEHEVDEERIREIMSDGAARSERFLRTDIVVPAPADRDVAPGVNAPLLQFDDSVDKQSYASATSPLAGLTSSRIQDPELQEMSDMGKCLSMHQPWASLLVEGIKMHEGRTWYSSHRGRLWIAATVKPPDQAVVRALENQYRVLYPDKQFKFPTFYPTGCLLGCVNVDDCLPQEEYQKIYPDGESDSPFVFICSNPTSLRIRFPIKGQHKIYKLDKTIHQAAVKCIQKMSKLEAEQANGG